MWCLTEEANFIALKDSINKSNAAMMVATSKSKNGKGKKSPNGKAKAHCTNSNCDKDGRIIDHCYAKGGGKEKEASEWFKKLAARKAASVSVHIAKDGKDDDKNYTMLTYSLPEDSTALIVTSEFNT